MLCEVVSAVFSEVSESAACSQGDREDTSDSADDFGILISAMMSSTDALASIHQSIIGYTNPN